MDKITNLTKSQHGTFFHGKSPGPVDFEIFSTLSILDEKLKSKVIDELAPKRIKIWFKKMEKIINSIYNPIHTV